MNLIYVPNRYNVRIKQLENSEVISQRDCNLSAVPPIDSYEIIDGQVYQVDKIVFDRSNNRVYALVSDPENTQI